MNLQDIPEDELSWTEEPVIGLALVNAEKDSNGETIDPHKYYNVAKHLPSGKIIIIATDKNMKHDFVNNVLNRQGRFN